MAAMKRLSSLGIRGLRGLCSNVGSTFGYVNFSQIFHSICLTWFKY